MMNEQALSNWVGNSVCLDDYLSESPARRLAATLNDISACTAEGSNLPPLAHWLYFLPSELQSELGSDGHPARGGFLPPVHHLPRRMWAGGRLEFMAPLQLGMRAQRVSTIKSVDKKVGKSGPLVFVTVEHRISELGGEVKLVEEHDIVYRGLQSVADPAACPRVPDLERRFAATATPDEVMLFRFSALTFNGHRIHYDHPYVVNTEGYAGLIVHGPLIAMLLARMAELHGAAALRRFSFRSMSPFTLGGALSLNMSGPDEDGCHSLWAAADTDRLVMQAEAWLK